MSAIGGKADIPATWIFIFLYCRVCPSPSALDPALFITPNPHNRIFALGRRSGPLPPLAMEPLAGKSGSLGPIPARNFEEAANEHTRKVAKWA
jgi:hypothetical protein